MDREKPKGRIAQKSDIEIYSPYVVFGSIPLKNSAEVAFCRCFGVVRAWHAVSFPPSPPIFRFQAGIWVVLVSSRHTYPIVFRWFPDQCGHFPEVHGRGGEQQFVIGSCHAT